MNQGWRRIAVWDLPVRLFHWTLVLLVVTSVATAKLDGLELRLFGRRYDHLDLHLMSGLAILTLVLFRLAWGLVGGGHARFASFVRGPLAGLFYLRDWLRRPDHPQRRHYLGHNPVGGWMVMLLLALLLVQVGTGLFATDDEGVFSGPLAKYVSTPMGEKLTYWHFVCQRLLLGCIALHVLAVTAYLALRRENLLYPMFSGAKSISPALKHVDEAPTRKPRLVLAIVLLAVAAAAVTALAKLA